MTYFRNFIDTQVPNEDSISPVLSLKKIKTSIINQELAQNGILMEKGTKQRLHPTFHRMFCLRTCEKTNMLSVCFKMSLLNMID